MSRDEKIISMRKSGYTLNVISQKYGISSQRVQQICQDKAGQRNRLFGVDISNSLYLFLQRNGINNISELRLWMQCHELKEMNRIGPKRTNEILHLIGQVSIESKEEMKVYG